MHKFQVMGGTIPNPTPPLVDTVVGFATVLSERLTVFNLDTRQKISSPSPATGTGAQSITFHPFDTNVWLSSAYPISGVSKYEVFDRATWARTLLYNITGSQLTWNKAGTMACLSNCLGQGQPHKILNGVYNQIRSFVMTPGSNNIGAKPAWSDDGLYLATGNTTNRIAVRETTNFTQVIQFLANFNNSQPREIAFWPGNDYIIGVSAPGALTPPAQPVDRAFKLFNALTGALYPIQPTPTPIWLTNVNGDFRSAFGVSFNPSGTLCAVSHQITPFVTVYNTATWAPIGGGPSVPAVNRALDVKFNWDGSLLAVAHDGPTGFSVFRTDTWAALSGWSHNLPSEGVAVDFG